LGLGNPKLWYKLNEVPGGGDSGTWHDQVFLPIGLGFYSRAIRTGTPGKELSLKSLSSTAFGAVLPPSMTVQCEPVQY
jgi:hypothetical protein